MSANFVLPPSTLSVLGTSLAVTSYAELSDFLLCRSALDGAYAVDFSNTHIVTMRRHDREFRALTECIDLFVPDGMPLIWCLNREGAGLSDRVYGPTFTRKFLSAASSETTHYLVGGSPECGVKFRQRLLSLNPNLRFVGGYHGPCSKDGILADQLKVTLEIETLRPDFIWVGLGTPKQYRWIATIKPKLTHGILLAVGFSFDVNAGTKPDAPLWMQKCGLTWLYRMASEPRRLMGRYLKWNVLFLLYLMLHPKSWLSGSVEN